MKTIKELAVVVNNNQITEDDLKDVVRYNKVVNKLHFITRELHLMVLPHNTGINVRLGGSFALWAQIPNWREPHDIDIVVSGDRSVCMDLYNRLCYARNILGSLNSNSDKSCYSARIPIPDILGKPAELLFEFDNRFDGGSCDLESVEHVLDIKRQYIKNNQALGIKPRTKDVEDVKRIENWLDSIDLPF